jgi:hypothetical protein
MAKLIKRKKERVDFYKLDSSFLLNPTGFSLKILTKVVWHTTAPYLFPFFIIILNSKSIITNIAFVFL